MQRTATVWFCYVDRIECRRAASIRFARRAAQTYTACVDWIIRNVIDADLGDVWALNQSETPHVGSVDLHRIRWFASHAYYFRVACDDHGLAGFLIGLGPGIGYESPNYLWFCQRYPEFGYVDRIAVAERARRRGLASRMYDDFAASLPATVPVMTCEVNLRPPNEASMRFHQRLGFRSVGSLRSDRGAKEVALLTRELLQ